MSLNLARRPFVNARPANLVAAVLLVSVIALTAVSVVTVQGYLAGSRATRDRMASVKGNIDRLEAERRQAEAGLARYDLGVLSEGADDAAFLARRRAFSWTRFLTRLEEVLPPDARVASIALQKGETSKEAGLRDVVEATVTVQLVLVSRDPDGLPKVIRALYASPYFDRPAPTNEDGPETGTPEGTRLSLGVVYCDNGKAPS